METRRHYSQSLIIWIYFKTFDNTMYALKPINIYYANVTHISFSPSLESWYPWMSCTQTNHFRFVSGLSPIHFWIIIKRNSVVRLKKSEVHFTFLFLHKSEKNVYSTCSHMMMIYIIMYRMNTNLKKWEKKNVFTVIYMPNKIELLFWLSDVMMEFWKSFTSFCKLPIHR